MWLHGFHFKRKEITRRKIISLKDSTNTLIFKVGLFSFYSAIAALLYCLLQRRKFWRRLLFKVRVATTWASGIVPKRHSFGLTLISIVANSWACHLSGVYIIMWSHWQHDEAILTSYRGLKKTKKMQHSWSWWSKILYRTCNVKTNCYRTCNVKTNCYRTCNGKNNSLKY